MNKNNQKSAMSLVKDDPFSSYTVGSLVIVAVLFLSLFFGWSYIYNTEVGVEIGINGWNYVCLSFTWYFKTTDTTVFGHVNSFYYYVKHLVVAETVLTMIAFWLLVSLVPLSCFNIKKANKKLTTVTAIVSIVLAVVFLACFVVSLTMSPKMVKGYCSGNKNCSVNSLAIIPALVAIVNAIVNFVLRVKLNDNSEN